MYTIIGSFFLYSFVVEVVGTRHESPHLSVLSANDQSAPVTDRPISHVCARVTQTVFSFFLELVLLLFAVRSCALL